MSDNNKYTLNFGGITMRLLGVLFIGLKLTGFIQWSWLWVLAPFWIPSALMFLVLGFIFVLGLVVNFWPKRF